MVQMILQIAHLQIRIASGLCSLHCFWSIDFLRFALERKAGSSVIFQAIVGLEGVTDQILTCVQCPLRPR